MITSNGVVKIADFQLAEKEHTDLGGKQFPVKWSALEVFYAGIQKFAKFHKQYEGLVHHSSDTFLL